MERFKCTYIQYHQNWTKFFFDNIETSDCVAISVICKVGETVSRKYKEGEIYEFQL